MDYLGTRFDQITELKYSTFRQSADAGNNLAIALQFNVDYDLSDASTSYQGRIVFEPYQGIGGNVPQNTWQQWDAKAGRWWGAKTSVPKNGVIGPNPCLQAAPCTWNQLLAAFPNIGVHATLGAIVLKAGSNWPGFRGNVDAFTIGVNGTSTTFDFEPRLTKRLFTTISAGISGTQLPADSTFAQGSVVNYSFAPASGYEHVIVVLDDTIVPASGSFVMSRDRRLEVGANQTIVLPSDDDPLVGGLRDLLTTNDPVDAYQGFVEVLASLIDDIGEDEADHRLATARAAVIDPVRDSAALRRLDDALAYHEYVLPVGNFSGDTGGGDGGGEATRRPNPRVAKRVRVRQASPSAPTLRRQSMYMAGPTIGSPERTAVVFINGIFNDPADAALSTTRLRRLLMQDPSLAQSSLYVTHWYNRNKPTEMSDYLKEREACVSAVDEHSRWLSWTGAVDMYAQCRHDERVYSEVQNDLREAMTQITQLRRNSPEHTVDVDSLVQFLTDHRAIRGEHLVVVSHSQGNLMLQQALQAMQASGAFAPAMDSLRIAVVAVSPPISTNWSVDPALFRAVLVAHDAILAVGGNTFPQINTPLSDAAAAAIANASAGMVSETPSVRNSAAASGSFAAFLWGIQIHQLNTGYLNQAAPRAAIVGGVVNGHREMTLGQLTVAPASGLLRIGSQLHLTLGGTNRNSHPYSFRRSVRWITRDGMTLSQTGTVTAVLPGVFAVQAKTAGWTATSNITVPVESLTVKATQTQNSFWGTLGEGEHPESARPGGNPAWDGDPTHCNQTITTGGGDNSYLWGQACTFGLNGRVRPPASITIHSYRWEFYSYKPFEDLVDIRTRTDDVVTLEERLAVNPPLNDFWGYDRVEVYGMDAAGRVIARGRACIRGCTAVP